MRSKATHYGVSFAFVLTCKTLNHLCIPEEGIMQGCKSTNLPTHHVSTCNAGIHCWHHGNWRAWIEGLATSVTQAEQTSACKRYGDSTESAFPFPFEEPAAGVHRLSSLCLDSFFLASLHKSLSTASCPVEHSSALTQDAEV